jgi:hypothetical protein
LLDLGLQVTAPYLHGAFVQIVPEAEAFVVEDKPKTSAVDALLLKGLDKSADPGCSTQKASKVGLSQPEAPIVCEGFDF